MAGILLVVTHGLFWLGGQHPNWLQPVIVVAACITAYAFAAAPVAQKHQNSHSAYKR